MEDEMRKANLACILTVGVLIFCGLFGGRAYAEGKAKKETPSIGYMNVEKVMKSHPELVKWSKEFEATKAASEKALAKSIKEKFGVSEGGEVPENIQKQFQEYYMQENNKFISKMKTKQDAKLASAEKDIRAAAAVVAKKKGMLMIVDKSVVIYGGVDVTNDVINEVKKKK